MASTASAARAGIDSWTPFGHQQGKLVAVAASSRGDLYAVAAFGDVAEVWHLPAGATTWRWRNEGLGRPKVQAIAVHPNRPDFVWVVSGGAAPTVYVSNGTSWFRLAVMAPGIQVRGLWAIPARTLVLFADVASGSNRRLLRSEDGGYSWRDVPGAVGPVAAPTDQPGVVYAGAARGGAVLRSQDGGLTFRTTRPPGVDTGDEVRALHATRGRRPLVFASFAAGKLFRSVDGSRWEQVAAAGYAPLAIASEPRDTRVVYAASQSAILVSTRSGRAGSFRFHSFFHDFLPPPVAMVTGSAGPVALAGGNLWNLDAAPLAATGMVSYVASELRVAAPNPSSIALRTYFNCVLRCDFRTWLSSDGGTTFRRHGGSLAPRIFLDVYDVAFDPTSAARRLESWSGALMLVDPSGFHQRSFGSAVHTVEITGGGGLLVGAADGVSASRDDGLTWGVTLPSSTARGSLRVFDLRADPGAPEHVVAFALLTPSDAAAAPELVAFRSTDAGASWTPVLGGAAGILDVEVFPGLRGTLYLLVAVPGGTELRRSDDDGRTAVTMHTFPEADAVGDLAIDAVTADAYVASAAGVLRSRDGGGTWESLGATTAWGAYRQRIARVWAHPTERGHLYAAPADGGLFENRLSD